MLFGGMKQRLIEREELLYLDLISTFFWVKITTFYGFEGSSGKVRRGRIRDEVITVHEGVCEYMVKSFTSNASVYL